MARIAHAIRGPEATRTAGDVRNNALKEGSADNPSTADVTKKTIDLVRTHTEMSQSGDPLIEEDVQQKVNDIQRILDQTPGVVKGAWRE